MTQSEIIKIVDILQAVSASLTSAAVDLKKHGIDEIDAGYSSFESDALTAALGCLTDLATDVNKGTLAAIRNKLTRN